MALLNPFTLKKYAALLIPPMLAVTAFYIGVSQFGLLVGIGLYIVAMIVGLLVGSALLTNPFTQMLEGKGILAINIDSTGILRPFILSVLPPYIKGKLLNKKVDDIFNRSTIAHLAAPIKNKSIAQRTEGGGIKIELDEPQFNEARFQLFHYPVVLYNQQIQSIITKDFLSGMEKDTFAEHGVLYLNRKMEELTSVVRDFGRHVVETLKPKQSLFKNKWVIVIIIIFAVILLVIFLPSIIQFVTGVGGNIGQAGEKLTGTVIPK